MDDRQLTAGPLAARIFEGDLRCLTYLGTEVVRRISYPVRNLSWGTMPVRTVSEEVGPLSYRRAFVAVDGGFEGSFEVTLAEGGAGLVADLAITALADLQVMRAGFTLLHPIAGVAGTEMVVVHTDGQEEATHFPQQISPGQPARDIAGLRHRVWGVDVSITMEGEVFEMEDQRNWSDASYKTYCRPLAWPRPFALRQGARVEQRLRIALAGAGDAIASLRTGAKVTGRMPAILLAHEDGLTGLDAALPPGVGLLARVSSRTPAVRLKVLRPDALEIVFAGLDDLQMAVARCRAAGMTPARVVALPAPYLQSWQPEGPWPQGARPADAIPVLRRGFPGALVGAGSLANFTEFNRSRPDPDTCDFATFGNTAIVHAADDLSVIETLEALPHVFASAKAIMGPKPLHLGLFSIGMRSNPYGDGVVENPDAARIPMAMLDPRQATSFAAAYALGVLGAAIAAGVESLALAMVSGPLGATGTPLARVIAVAAGRRGATVRVTEGAGLTGIEWDHGGMLANLSAGGLPHDKPGLRLTSGGPVASAARGMLAPTEVLLWGDAG